MNERRRGQNWDLEGGRTVGRWVWVGELLLSQHGWMIGFNWYVYVGEEMMILLYIAGRVLFRFIQYEKNDLKMDSSLIWLIN
jgi:hypothetical protein